MQRHGETLNTHYHRGEANLKRPQHRMIPAARHSGKGHRMKTASSSGVARVCGRKKRPGRVQSFQGSGTIQGDAVLVDNARHYTFVKTHSRA